MPTRPPLRLQHQGLRSEDPSCVAVTSLSVGNGIKWEPKCTHRREGSRVQGAALSSPRRFPMARQAAGPLDEGGMAGAADTVPSP